MRTTLTLDPDVAAELERRIEEEGATLKSVVNQVLRLGLARLNQDSARPRKHHALNTVSVGRVLQPNLDNVGEVLERLNDRA